MPISSETGLNSAQNGMKAEAKSLAVRASSILIFALLVVGCTHYAVVDAKLESPPLVERLPLTVGVFFSPEFESYVHTAQIGEGPSVAIIPVGQPSIALFDQIFDSMFERSARVDSRGPLPHTAQNLDGVIEIALDSFVAGYGAGGRVTIKLQVTVYDSSGQTIVSWPVIGTGEEKYFHELFQTFGLETERAIRNAAGNFIIDFYDKPEITRWLESAGVS